MNILAGITRRSRTWEQLLRREGLPWRSVNLATGEGVAECSIVIVAHPLDAGERDAVEQYLRGGGSLLAYAGHVAGVAGTSVRRETLHYIASDGDNIFPSVRMIDLALEADVPREANHLRTHLNHHAVFAGALLGGTAVLLPFDVQRALADTRTISKAFYARRDRLPTERVSLVSRGEIFQLCHDALEYLHHSRSLPYVHLWYFPGTAPNVLAFRIDTDGAPRHDVDALYEVLRNAGVAGTWFLDVAAHEPWLPHFAALAGQELGLHCYEHRIEKDLERQFAQWERALAMMRKAGFAPAGVAAPFGAWNPGLGEVIDRLGLLYSSEFSCAYDALPLVPEDDDRAFRTLQVPIHPISIGSLRRSGATSRQMEEYYRFTLDAHRERDIPLFFYHHPTHRHWDVVDGLLEHALSLHALPVSMGEYARWWIARDQIDTRFEVRASVLRIHGASALADARIGVRVSLSASHSMILPSEDTILLDSREPSVRKNPFIPDDLRRIREPDPRRLLGDLYTAMLRRLK